MQNETFTTKIPFKYFDNSECYKIFCDLINDKQFVVTNYNFNRPNPNSTMYKYYSMDDNNFFIITLIKITIKNLLYQLY